MVGNSFNPSGHLGRSTPSIVRWMLLSGFLLVNFLANSQTIDHDRSFFKFGMSKTFHPEKRRILSREIEDIIEIQSLMEDNDRVRVAYWNAAYPSYRWHQIMMDVGQSHNGPLNGGRMAILHLAMYDAMVEVWRQKNNHEQKPPFLWNKLIRKYGRETDYSSFICERSAAAVVAKEIITYYFPERSFYLDSLLEDFKISRLQSGLQFSSDIKKGLEIGQSIAMQYIAYAKTDQTDKLWEGKVPDGNGLWTGNPGQRDPMKAKWQPLTLKSQDQFRPGPHPDFSNDMKELIRFNQENTYSDIAWKWKSEPVWDDLIEKKVLEYDLDPIDAAFANALFHVARYDAIIAAWDGKYYYWGIRPFQYDPGFKPILVDTPNFPGYPAGHTTVAGSIATVLSYLFPLNKDHFFNLAKECSESRFEGGVHFRTDNDVGLEIGYKVGQHVIEAFTD